MNDKLFDCIQHLIRKAPASWLVSACEALRVVPATATAEFLIKRLPETNNADLSYLMASVIQQAEGVMTWESLSWSLQSAADTYTRMAAEHQIELLWSGPAPDCQIPARRIDQALYDLIAKAKHEILLMTFAAAKIQRLADELMKAIQRGVKVRLILEFADTSEGQLSFDALTAFPATLVEAAEVYYWPVEKRERNQAGKPGKLHAKVALVDEVVLISSANLTEDAFNRNMELGAIVYDEEFVGRVAAYISALIMENSFNRV